MPEAHAARGATPFARLVTAVALLWLAGISLRLTILAVPPVIRLIHDDLHLTETQVGILSGLPLVLFALAAVPGSLLIARLGALPTLIMGLLIAAGASALRGAIPNIWLLYATTIVMGFGISVMQPALPPLVRALLPDRVGFGTAVYANGLLVGEILPVALMPSVLPLVDGSWRMAFVAWSIPCVAIALVILPLAPRRAAAVAPLTPIRWWPNWRDGRIWRLGLMFSTVNSIYFSLNAFIPDYLHHAGQPSISASSRHRCSCSPMRTAWSAASGPTSAAGCCRSPRSSACCSGPVGSSSRQPARTVSAAPPFSSSSWRCRRCWRARTTSIA